MKIPLFLCIFICSAVSSGIAQDTGWLRTDKKEFEKLFPYFDTIIRDSKYYKELANVPEQAVPDTLTIGTYDGTMNDAMGAAGEKLTFDVRQTFPIVKGFLYTIRVNTDTPADTVGGEVRGIRRGNHYIMVCQFTYPTNAYLIFLEGDCYKVKDYTVGRSMLGNMEAEHEWYTTKGNFVLRKKI